MTQPRKARAISPTLGRPVLTAGDAKELWRRYFGDRPVPVRPKANLRRLTEQAETEQIRRAQLEAARQRLEGANLMPWPDCEAAWLQALAAARAVFGTAQPATRNRGMTS